MVCIYCGEKTQVTNSRSSKRSPATWRRRQCAACKAITTSRETYDLEAVLRVKNRAALEPFLRDKLLLCVYQSLSHRKTALKDATALTETIIERIIKESKSGLVEIDEIITITSGTLKRFDKAAEVHYLAHHQL